MANELVTKAYDIDISQTGARPIVRLSQYDTRTIRVLFTVYDGTELQIIDGCTARVDGRRSDGTAFTKSCDIESGSKVAFTVEAEMTNSAGMHNAELVILNSDGNPLGTQNFTIDVERAPFEREFAATVEDRTLYDQYTSSVDTRVAAALKKADDAVTADTGKVDKLVSDTQAKIDAIVSESVVPIERGGTGATSIDAARRNLHISQGSKVCHGHGTPWVTLFDTWEDFQAETGCYDSGLPTLVTMNGDWGAFDGSLSGCEIKGGDAVYVMAQTTSGFPKISSTQSLRINWICIW
jgi:hypothetical protein